MLKSFDDAYCDWTTHNHNSFSKSFHFKSKENLTDFVLTLIKREHEPGDPTLKMTENASEISIEVSVEINKFDTYNDINSIIQNIELTFHKYEKN